MAKAKIGFKDFVFLFEPETITHVLQKNNKNYVKSFAYKGLKAFLGNGLLTAEQNIWLKNKRALQPGFIQKEIVLLNDNISDAIDYKINQLDLDKTHNLQELFLDWTKDILLKSLFGLNNSEIKELGNIHTHLWFLRNYANSRMKNPFMAPQSWPTKTNKRIKIAIKELEIIILKLFKLSANRTEKEKLVQHILAQQEKGAWSDQQVFDEIITLFLAGQETTTNAMVFLVHCLNEYPDYLTRVKIKMMN